MRVPADKNCFSLIPPIFELLGHAQVYPNKCDNSVSYYKCRSDFFCHLADYLSNARRLKHIYFLQKKRTVCPNRYMGEMSASKK